LVRPNRSFMYADISPAKSGNNMRAEGRHEMAGETKIGSCVSLYSYCHLLFLVTSQQKKTIFPSRHRRLCKFGRSISPFGSGDSGMGSIGDLFFSSGLVHRSSWSSRSSARDQREITLSSPTPATLLVCNDGGKSLCLPIYCVPIVTG
jgi:hypothetical protein